MRSLIGFPFLLLLILTGQIMSSKILAYLPFPAYSHHRVFQPILYELGRRGHQIDYVSPFDMETFHPNVTHVSVRNIMKDVLERVTDISYMRQLRMPIHTLLGQINRFSIATTKEICLLKPIQSLIRSNAVYDLVIHEGPFLQEHAGVLLHRFKAPGVAILPSPTISIGEVTGLPDNPSHVVDTKLAYSNRMSFFQRLHNTYSVWLTVLSHYFLMRQTQSIVDDCFKYPTWEDRQSLNKLASDNALVLVNNHVSLGFSYPTAPHVKLIGGVNILPNKPLPKDLDVFLTKATNGVIYFSLGSIFDLTTVLGTKVRDMYARAFSRMNETVLWKSNEEPWPEIPNNVRVAKWFPQQDVLAHKNVKLFITQGGLISLFETVHHAVPVLVIPIFSDQAMNARRTVDSGLGERIAVWDVTEDELFNRMRQIIDNPRYAREIERKSALLKDRAMKPVEESAYWIEYILRHGRVLQPASVNLSFFQLHQLDVWGFVISLLLVICYCMKTLGILIRQYVSPRPTVMRSFEKKIQ